MKAVIMAGGKGTRMHPLTCDLPKPMLPVMNRPVMDHTLRLLKRHNISDIIVTLMFMPQKVIDYFADGSDWNVHIDYAIEESPLGTAGSVCSVSRFLDETFVVISGDCITNINLNEAIKFHNEKKAAITLVLKRVDYPLDFGIAITDNRGAITEFFEKPAWGEVFSDTANTGIYIMEPWVLNLIDPTRPYDFSRDLFPLMLAVGHPVYGYITDAYWNDIGSIDSYTRTHQDWFEGQITDEFTKDTGRKKVWVGENTVIHPSAVIKGPCMIGSDCSIGADVRIDRYTVIGNGCTLQSNTTLKRSILWDNCRIDRLSELSGCILGNNTKILYHVSAYENTIIGSDSLIGERSILKPNIKIWPKKVIEAQSVVDRNVIWTNRHTRSLFGQNDLSGVINADMTPEFASRLGSAYGSLFEKGSSVVVSSDRSHASLALKMAFSAGLISVGINVYEIKETIVPCTRLAIGSLPVEGGVHFSQNDESIERIHIRFFDAHGLNADKTLQKSIEAGYLKEEFRRCASFDIAKIIAKHDFLKVYANKLVSQSAQANPSKHTPFRHAICIASSRKETLLFMERVLIELGCMITSSLITEGFSSYLMLQEMEEHKASISAYLDGNGENMILMDTPGRILSNDQLFMVMAYMLFRSYPGYTVYAPVNMTAALEILAERYGGYIKRTKTSIGIQQKALCESSDEKLSYQVVLQNDPLSALSFMLTFLSDHNMTLEEVVAYIPSYRVEYASIHCPWESMGRVMRLLIKETDPSRLDLTDGIKIFNDKSWVLILPDNEQPLLHLYAEGKSPKEALKIVKVYTSKIETFIEERG